MYVGFSKETYDSGKVIVFDTCWITVVEPVLFSIVLIIFTCVRLYSMCTTTLPQQRQNATFICNTLDTQSPFIIIITIFDSNIRIFNIAKRWMTSPLLFFIQHRAVNMTMRQRFIHANPHALIIPTTQAALSKCMCMYCM